MAIYKPTLEEARGLVDQGNLIPVYRELPADLETPVSVFLKLRNGGPSFLLESVEKGEQVGRYSFIGVHPPMSVCGHGDQVIIGGAGGQELERQQGDPLEIVRELMADRKPSATIWCALSSGCPKPRNRLCASPICSCSSPTIWWFLTT